MFATLMLVAGTATLTLATYVSRQGPKPIVRSFALMLAAVALWLVCISGWSFAPTIEVARAWLWLQFLGVAAVPVLLLTYVLHFTGRTRALTTRHQILLWAIPALTQVFAWTNDSHHLMFREVNFVRSGGLFVLAGWAPGSWFLLHSAYSFGIAGVALVLMARAAYGAPNIFRRQLLALLIAIAPGFVLTLLNTFQLLSADLWITPMGFMLTGAAVIWAIVSHQMIAVVPVARDMLIEQMDDAMLVVDERGRIIDLNPAMEALLGRRVGDLLSRPLAEVLRARPSMLRATQVADAVPVEIELDLQRQARQYEVIGRTLRHRGAPVGRLLVLRDITRLKRAQAELFSLATIDGLTGLYNRRQFFSLAESQVEIAGRNRRPLAVLLFDIDHFKQINDRYGHQVGDQALVAVAARVREVTRAADVVCRYGGEEFAVLLVEAGCAEALAAAERLRTAVADAPMAVGADAVALTVSVGVAVSSPDAPQSLDGLLRHADAAMYRAKQAGRNRVMITKDAEGGERREGEGREIG